MTVALCDALRGSSSDLVQQVGQDAAARHAADVTVLVSVARMYIDSNRYADAQTVLVAAGKQAPRDADVYRWLGETLLRRGDADRAEKVLQRAIQLGSTGADARIWLDRAKVFKPMQAKAGTRAVAAEVAHTSQPARELLDSMSENTTDVHLPRPKEFAKPKPSPLPPAKAPSKAPAAVTPRAAAVQLPDEPRQFSKSAQTFPTAFEPPEQDAPARDEVSNSSEVDISVSGVAPLPTSPAPTKPLTNGHANHAATPSPAPVKAKAKEAPKAAPAEPTGGSVPHPRDVLDALTFAGVYEPAAAGAARPAVWDRPGAGPKRKGTATLIASMVVFVAGAVGTYVFYQHKRAQDHLVAEALLATVEAQLHAARPDSLSDAEASLGRALALESRSPRAALDWARERAIVGLVKSGSDVAFEDAMARAKDVGVGEDKYAFAHVASFLFQNDTAGAAGELPKWDGPAAGDAWYQLVTGAALERAGDARARDRYAAAVKLDADLLPAQVGLARVTAIAGDAQDAMKLARELRLKLPDRAEPLALVALAWGRDPQREDLPVPPEVEQLRARADELPSGLAFVPHAVAALAALDKRAADDARAEVQAGLAVADSPGAAVWLGTIALPLGDEGLARKAALAALQLSAAYEPARALAARVALLGGRLDEALKATEDLDPGSADAAVVRAAAAYERVDADGVSRGLDAVPAEARKQPLLAGLSLASEALSGHVALDPAKLVNLANDDAPWANLIAMDLALDGGDLATADKIAIAWGKEAEQQALCAVRLARLARYEGRLDAADALSKAALDSATVTPRVLWERVFTLVAKDRAAEVGPLLGRYPLVLGPLATWMSAYATASNGSAEAAKAKTAAIDPPPQGAPLEVRVVAAAAFGAMKDRRHGADYVKEVLATGSLHPDLVAAALALGFHRVEHGKRRPTYE